MNTLLRSFAGAAMSMAVLPASGFADLRPFQGAITVAWTAAENTEGVSFCGGPAMTYVATAHGVGTTSLGAMSFSLRKSLEAVGPMHGCATLTDVNGDTLYAVYDGTEGDVDPSNFQFGAGTLTITGGTGRFRGAKGKLRFTASFSLIETGSYLFAGTVSLRE